MFAEYLTFKTGIQSRHSHPVEEEEFGEIMGNVGKKKRSWRPVVWQEVELLIVF